MTRHATTLPRFVPDLLASPPRRGGGLNLWLYRDAGGVPLLSDPTEIMELLRGAPGGEHVKRGEIERAVERSKVTACNPGQPPASAKAAPWPKYNPEQREAVIASG